jgi:elongation factor P
VLGITDLKTGVAIDMQGDPCIVLSYQHSKQGRSGAVMRTRLRNLKTSAVFDITFKGGDKFDEAVLEKRACSFLYKEGENYSFMDSQSFEQFTLTSEEIGSKASYLKEGGEIHILFYEDKPVSIELPIKMEFTIAHTEPGVKGDTAQGGSKPAILETGAPITVPLFVKIGDIVRVNTTEGTYVERVKQ